MNTKIADKKKKSKKKPQAKDRVLKILLNPHYEGKGTSFTTIAKLAKLSSRQHASILVNKLKAEGKILVDHTEYEHPRYPTAQCCGKNIYKPGPNAPKKYLKKPEKNSSDYDTNSRKETLINKSLLEKKPQANFFGDLLKKKRRKGENLRKKTNRFGKKHLFAKYGFEKYLPRAPKWWFRDKAKLEAALRLIRNKLKKGFKLRSFINFLSHLLKHGVFGYRRHCSRNLCVALSPNLNYVIPYLATAPIETGYCALKELKHKHGLDTTFTSMSRLLRRGYAHLAMASEVMIKRLKFKPVRSVTGYLNFLVSLKEPYDVLKPKGQKSY